MIGVLGGTFNPVHYGHLRCAVEVMELFGLDEVRLIPNANPPHRGFPSVEPLCRVQMLELAITHHPKFICDQREIDRYQRQPSQPSYMLDTLVSLREDFPIQPVLLFIGLDAFRQLPNWYCWQQLFDYAHIVVMTRPGWNMPSLDGFLQAKVTEQRTELQTLAAGRLFFQAVTPLDISATAIRSCFARQLDPSFLLPDAVIEYINIHKLYQSPE